MTSALLNNRYRLLRTLGSGGFGETFVAEDTYMPSGRLCVVKQLKPLSDRPQVYHLVCDRFQREAALLEQLGEGCDRIPKLYAYFTENGRFYLVQEWIEGLTLTEKVLNGDKFTPQTLQTFLLSLLPVLSYIHSQGVIHRDIKPSNIIWRQPDGKPVLIDFGVAKEMMTTGVDPHQAPSLAVGTRGYMPPEQAAGFPVYASDLYSLALTAIFLLTGKAPQQLNFDPQTGELDWRRELPNLNPGLLTVFRRSLKLHPKDRYPNAEAMRLAVRELGNPSPQPSYFHPASAPTLPLSQPETPTSPPPVSPKTSPSQNLYSYPQEYRYRQILLNKVKNYWIKGVLESSLHGKALLELGLEQRLDAIENPWGMVWETSTQARQPLPAHTKIIHLFDQLGAGRSLLILGEPGSGKTTTLLELARDLMIRAEHNPDYPIPVIFNLSSWTTQKQGSLTHWIIQELNTKYQVSQAIGQAWVNSEQLLLLLDGLDEVNSEHRQPCVQAINQFLQERGQTELVICCRLQEYEALATRLRCQGAVFIQPLSLDQAYHYLTAAGSDLTAVVNTLQADPMLQELVRSPLMLSIIALAYQGLPLTDLPHLTLEEYRQHLFNRYIQRMFKRRQTSPSYSQEQALRWLSWLAQRMSQDSQTVFLIERMQPSWLQTPQQKQLYFWGVWITFILLGGAIGLAVMPLERVLFLLLAVSFILASLFGVNRIQPVEQLKWSWKNLIKNSLIGVILGSLIGTIIKICYEIIFKPSVWQSFVPYLNSEQQFALIRGLVFGACVGLLFGLVRGLTAPSIQTVTKPNYGIRQSCKNALIFGFMGFLGLGLAAQSLKWSFLYWAIFGFGFGFIIGGGEACIKHLILRLVFYHSQAIPWNYANFLDFATERLFLQKVGGGYIFVHRLLLEHFARKNP